VTVAVVAAQEPRYTIVACPLLNGVLHVADRVAIFGKQVGIELISIITSHVDIAHIRESARKRGHLAVLRLGAAEAETAARIKLIGTRENRFIKCLYLLDGYDFRWFFCHKFVLLSRDFPLYGLVPNLKANLGNFRN
jgi:hypothetical protein